MRSITLTLAVFALSACTAAQSPTPHEPQAPVVSTQPPQPSAVTSTPVPMPAPIATPSSFGSVEQLKSIASSSSCAKFDFQNQGAPRKSWLRGIAVVYARAVCRPNRPEVTLLMHPAGQNDALTWYGLKGDPLQSTYALMVGLAARESSWRYCCGRDMSSGFSSASSAEAGFLQTSYGARLGKDGLPRAGGVLNALYLQWKASDRSKCLLDVFSSDLASCGDVNAKIWGDGDGASWQQLTKSCPAFAAEYGALVMRFNGGSAGEFGPIRRKTAQFVPACFEMFGAVGQYVKDHPDVCQQL